jgi:hypothetical protein
LLVEENKGEKVEQALPDRWNRTDIEDITWILPEKLKNHGFRLTDDENFAYLYFPEAISPVVFNRRSTTVDAIEKYIRNTERNEKRNSHIK